MALNLERILEQTGESKEEFAEEMGISVEELDNYVSGSLLPTADLVMKMSGYTGLSAEELETGQRNTKSHQFNVEDTWAPSTEAKNNLFEYLTEGIQNFEDDLVKDEILKVKECLQSWRKPKISVAGQSDTGKSTLINALIGSEKLPAKWTPTTSIIVYIKHIEDRPPFIKDDVWIFGKSEDELWEDEKLSDEDYCKRFLIKGGSYGLLESYGTHQNEKNDKEAYSAVAFVDSPILKDCDIVDMPGLGATEEDDSLHGFSTQKTDILIYLSRANGFLQDGDINYISTCINSLSPIEEKDGDIKKLENLFIVAAQSGTVENGNATELEKMMDTQCRKLCKNLKAGAETYDKKINSLLPRRTKDTGLEYCESDFRARFFTYERDMPRLCKKFIVEFEELIEKLPEKIHDDFSKMLRETAGKSGEKIGKRINTYEQLMEDKKKYAEMLRKIKDKEPARISIQLKKTNELVSQIDELCVDSKRELQKFYIEFMCEDSLIKEIEKADCKNKKSDKEDFVARVGKILAEKSQSIIDKNTDTYSKKLNEYLNSYNKSLNEMTKEQDVNVSFDVTDPFLLGISALGVLGASAAWLTTSFTATIVTLFTDLATTGMFAAFGGVLTAGVGAAAAAIVAVVKAMNWKKNLAKSVIKAYEKGEYIQKSNEHIEQYWEDTKVSLAAGVKAIEEDWGKHIAEYEELADEKNLPMLQEKINVAKRGMSFFEKMPLPDSI